MEVGQILAELRTEKGLYQKELAAYLRVSVGTISNYENGVHYPDPDTLCKLAEFFEVTTDYLLGRTSFRYNPELLYRPLTESYSVSDLVNTTLVLTPRNKRSLADFMDLLKLRNDSELSQQQ